MNAIVLIDKPKGMSSLNVVQKVKNLLKSKRAGHTGTLDPFATGVLPICINNATKVIPFLDESIKEYEAVLKLGVSTNTLDETGEIINTREVTNVSVEEILDIFSKIEKENTQIPPMYSAIKHRGRRLYEYARRGFVIDRKPRSINIEKLELIELNPPNLKFFIRCSRGTYVRVIASEIGERLGYGGHLVELRRIKSGNFKLEDTISLEDITSGMLRLIPIQWALSHIKILNVSSMVSGKVKSGQQIRKFHLDLSNAPDFDAGELLMVCEGQEIVSISEAIVSSRDLDKFNVDKILIKHLRVFN